MGLALADSQKWYAGMSVFSRLVSLPLRTRRGFKNQRGAVALEFALVVPVLLLILIGVIQYGNIFYMRHVMAFASREAARSYAVGESNGTQAQTLAANLLAANSTLNFTVNVTEPTGSSADVIVTISLPMADAGIVNILGSLLSGNIESSATMRVLSAAP